jgi:hypothetical protein
MAWKHISGVVERANRRRTARTRYQAAAGGRTWTTKTPGGPAASAARKLVEAAGRASIRQRAGQTAGFPDPTARSDGTAGTSAPLVAVKGSGRSWVRQTSAVGARRSGTG